jgi:hypothetical protein
MGIEIRDGDIFPTDPAPDAYQLAVATLIHSLSEETFPDRDVEANRLQEASYSLAQKLARQSVT